MPAHALYFLTYDAISNALHRLNHKDQVDNSNAQIMLAGALAGSAYWLVAYPLDTLKTRMQFDASVKRDACYPTLRSVWRDRRSTLLSGLCRGMLPTVLRAAPTNALAFLAFESARRRFDVEQR